MNDAETAAGVDARLARFLESCNWSRSTVTRLAADASRRRFFRVARKAQRAVVMDASAEPQGIESFIRMDQIFRSLGYSAPAIYDTDLNEKLILMEDLGDALYTHLLNGGMDAAELYLPTVSLLADLAHATNGGLMQEHNTGTPLSCLGIEQLDAELEVFLDWYVPMARGRPVDVSERSDFKGLWAVLFRACCTPAVLSHRDMHAANLIWLPRRSGLARIGVLDFQDAALGPLAYDLASLMQDTRRYIPTDLREQMFGAFVKGLQQRGMRVERGPLSEQSRLLCLQRNLRILGVLARLAVRDWKPRFAAHMELNWRYIGELLEDRAFKDLRQWLALVVRAERCLQPVLSWS